MAQTQKFQGVKTNTVSRFDGGLSGFYRGTEVARKNADGSVTLNSGGWQTATTKMRINQFANEFCSGRFSVYQKAGQWFVHGRGGDPERPEPFYDGMIV